MSFIPNPNETVTQEEGGQDKLRVQTLDNDALLREILKELKKMNFYLSQMSDLQDGSDFE